MNDEPKFEHDGPDDLEETEKALQAERDERDAELGYALAWEQDTSLIAAHRVMSKLFDQLLDAITITRGLQAGGLPKDVQTVQMPLDRISGPLVMTGLQLLGLYFPELREEIKATLRSIPRPTATDEEKEQIQAAIDELDRMEAEASLAVVKELEEQFARLRHENGDASMN